MNLLNHSLYIGELEIKKSLSGCKGLVHLSLSSGPKQCYDKQSLNIMWSITLKEVSGSYAPIYKEFGDFGPGPELFLKNSKKEVDRAKVVHFDNQLSDIIKESEWSTSYE